MKIRYFKPKDKKSVSELYYKLHPIEKGKKPMVSFKKSRIKRVLFIAEENKEIVGFVLGHLISYADFKYGSIDEFFVKKGFRGRKIGSLLLKKAIKELEKFNPNLILVGTEKTNKEAIKLYQKIGFEIGKKSLWFYWNPKKKY
jgi:N-alpha-acetyltransferase 30